MSRFYITLIFLTTVMSQAQVLDTDVLFSVNETPVYAHEFIRVFNKNLDLVQDESQKDVDEYLNLFVNYKLKLNEAQALGLDKKPSYQRELEGYKEQLAKNYLTNNQVTNTLVEEAYHRVTNEVKASHVLIRLNQNATPQDTLNAYNELLKIREQIKAEGFETVKNKLHDGKTIFVENLGFFSGFKMVYNFETVAYNTAIDEISMPFKTRFGYHIIKVFDKRKSRGERVAAHIMISGKENGTNQKQSPESRINDIYAKLKQGEEFETLAMQFSEDKSTAKKGGMLPPFESGQLSSPEFEEQAFAIKAEGEITKPFKTEYGWHIVKLHKILPVKTFEEMKSQLEAKVKRDSRSQLINEALVNQLKKDYNITENNAALSYFETILNKDYFTGQWHLPENFTAQKLLVKIGELELTYQDFGKELEQSQRKATAKKLLNTIVKDNYNTFLANHLVAYRKSHLEEENQEYANIVSEYRDGLLLFDLMETKIWNAAKVDTLGLKQYFTNHKENYFWGTRVNAEVVSSANKSMIKKAIKLMQNGTTQETIKQTLNHNGQVNVIFTAGLMELDHQLLPNDLVLEEGISKIYNKNDAFLVVKINEILPKTAKNFNDIKGTVLTDYQNYKEAKFIKALHDKYTVNINQDILAKVKSQIKN